MQTARHHWPAVLVLVGLALALFGTAVPAASGAVSLQPISQDPYTNQYSQHKTQVEPHVLAVGGTLVAAFQTGRFFAGGSSDIGWARSIDDGQNWTPGFLPGLTVFESAGTYASASDPTVAYDQKHDVWMIASLGLFPGPTPGTFADPSDVLVSRSIDGAQSWQSPVMVAGNGVENLDKPWVVCDNTPASPFYGNCYATFDNFGSNNIILMSTSTDGGQTWSAEQQPSDLLRGIGGVPLVRPDGTVVVPIQGYHSGRAYIDAFTSDDGGATWSASTHISQIAFYSIPLSTQKNIRSDVLPSAAIDSNGKIFVTWNDCGLDQGCSRNNVVFATSADGVTWSKVKRVPLDAADDRADYVSPSIGIDPDTAGASARIGLTTYAVPNPNCKPARCTVAIDFASSTDGGKHWTRGKEIQAPMRFRWAPATSSGYMFGDYFATAVSSDGKAVPVLSVALAPTTTLQQAISSARMSIVAGSFGTRAEGGRASVPPTDEAAVHRTRR